jgi:predicted Fe-Mo cluster-binding NifX family protein
MKVVVSSTGKDLDSEIDPRFGRCAYFIVVDTDTMDYEAFDNGNLALGGGAGIQSAQFVASKGAKVAITGNCGPNAVRTLAAAGVEVIVGQAGIVRRVIEDFKSGRLKTTTEANVADHYGVGGGGQGDTAASASSRGAGMGRGGGMGGGCRRSLGQGMGRGGGMGGYSATAFSDGSVSTSHNEEVALLKEQIRELQAQVTGLQSRMKDSEKT